MADVQEKIPEIQVSSRAFQETFPDFAENDVASLCHYLEIREFPEGAIVWKPGDPARFMGFLLHGKLLVKREGRFPGKLILLAILEKGTFFGETAISPLQCHTATLTAAVHSQAGILSQENARKLFEQEPALGIKLLKRIVIVGSLRLQHSGLRLAELL
ncbi:MAG: cyclic nucleotide-binding domain-containing protein [Deltaproteobacteria bacterium]|nr:cyclic nucleotide-binding domain-containing protein [Deltaproteobacteria bacterium]